MGAVTAAALRCSLLPSTMQSHGIQWKTKAAFVISRQMCSFENAGGGMLSGRRFKVLQGGKNSDEDRNWYYHRSLNRRKNNNILLKNVRPFSRNKPISSGGMVSHSFSTFPSENENKEKFYITTPIYYVNDKPHIGHLYTTLACDVLAQFWRLDGRKVRFLTGTDEHGLKVQESALRRGMKPIEFCDELSGNFKSLIEDMGFSHDQFIRTTEKDHIRTAQYFWKVLESKGSLYLGTYAGWYSVNDEAFYNEAELVDGKAPTGSKVEWVEKEPSYFFKLSDFQQPLLDFYEKNPNFVAPQQRMKEVVSVVQGGLKDLSVSRTSFDWGISLPSDEGKGHVMYVWMDALVNYLSALGYPDGKDFEEFWPADIHVIGKDILRFHAIYWPAFLMAAGLPLPKQIFAHGWWTKDGQKISKSTGNIIDPIDVVNRLGIDQTRWFLMNEVAFGNDGDFNEKQLVLRTNSNLANGMGNLVQRTLSLAYRNCNGVIPNRHKGDGLRLEDHKLINMARNQILDCRHELKVTQRFDIYCNKIKELFEAGNKYIDLQTPWTLRKTDPERMEVVLWTLMEVIRCMAILSQPVLPKGTKHILDMMKIPVDQRTFEHLTAEHEVVPGIQLDYPTPTFPRIRLEEQQKHSNIAKEEETPRPSKKRKVQDSSTVG